MSNIVVSGKIRNGAVTSRRIGCGEIGCTKEIFEKDDRGPIVRCIDWIASFFVPEVYMPIFIIWTVVSLIIVFVDKALLEENIRKQIQTNKKEQRLLRLESVIRRLKHPW